MTLAGTVLGFGIAGWMPEPRLTFLAAAVVMALGGLSLLGIGDGTYDDEDHAHVRDWHDFVVVFVARALVFFGLVMLQTFVLFFFRDVQKVGNPSAGTALYAFATIAGALISSIYLGLLSDRYSRKIVTSLAGACMALATIGFALAPELRWMLPLPFSSASASAASSPAAGRSRWMRFRSSETLHAISVSGASQRSFRTSSLRSSAAGSSGSFTERAPATRPSSGSRVLVLRSRRWRYCASAAVDLVALVVAAALRCRGDKLYLRPSRLSRARLG